MDLAIYIPYGGKILRKINFTVFKDFTAASKINSSKSFCITECYGNLVDPQNLSRKIYCGQITSKIFFPQKLPASYIAIQYICDIFSAMGPPCWPFHLENW